MLLPLLAVPDVCVCMCMTTHALLITFIVCVCVSSITACLHMHMHMPMPRHPHAFLQAQLREAEKEVLRWEHKYNCSTDPTSPTSPTSPLSPTSPPPAGTPVKDAKDGLLALSRTSLKAHAPQLVGIVGQVGSGKSTMLAAILGEVKVWLAFCGAMCKVGRRIVI